VHADAPRLNKAVDEATPEAASEVAP
jgi:hypothetical protein